MNSHWLTTLKSGLKSGADQVRSRLEQELSARGVRLSPQDLAALVEQLSPELSQKILSLVNDLTRPFGKGMGLRMAQLTENSVEFVLPDLPRNKDEEGHIHVAALVTAALEALRTLWARHTPLSGLRTQVENLEITFHKKEIRGSLRLKYHLEESEREALLTSLRINGRAQLNALISVYSDQESAVAEVAVKLSLASTPQIEGAK